jgi:hypothetical protein
MITEIEYKAMAKDLCRELSEVWGRDKFQEWWECNIITMNGVITWDYKSLYLVLKSEHDYLMELRDRVFGGSDSYDWAKETQELRAG